MGGCNELSNHAIKTVVNQWAATEQHVSRVFLFGSRARGDNQPESDVDLAIDVIAQEGSSRKETYFAWLHPWRTKLKELFGCKIEFAMHPDDNPDYAELQVEIERDKIQLYPRNLGRPKPPRPLPAPPNPLSTVTLRPIQ